MAEGVQHTLCPINVIMCTVLCWADSHCKYLSGVLLSWLTLERLDHSQPAWY